MEQVRTDKSQDILPDDDTLEVDLDLPEDEPDEL